MNEAAWLRAERVIAAHAGSRYGSPAVVEGEGLYPPGVVTGLRPAGSTARAQTECCVFGGAVVVGAYAGAPWRPVASWRNLNLAGPDVDPWANVREVAAVLGAGCDPSSGRAGGAGTLEGVTAIRAALAAGASLYVQGWNGLRGGLPAQAEAHGGARGHTLLVVRGVVLEAAPGVVGWRRDVRPLDRLAAWTHVRAAVLP